MLAQWRYLGRGLKHLTIGRHIRCRERDLREWLDMQTVAKPRRHVLNRRFVRADVHGLGHLSGEQVIDAADEAIGDMAEARLHVGPVFRRRPVRPGAAVISGELLCRVVVKRRVVLVSQKSDGRPEMDGVVALVARYACLDALLAEVGLGRDLHHPPQSQRMR
jgi:hypothetical protein